MNNIIAGFKDVYTNIKDYINKKPVLASELELMLSKFEAIDNKFNGLTKKYWNDNSHLLDDEPVFL